ncbi:V-type ATP synthase beta chain [Candidatus Sulfobium mesophilum]|uniref:V-type ATP synthase beta chain n=1 Tax=Candidatus Sulfobium mesophilum TaxID=2016548 RepID=A0A2U3QFP5_9BACT|nr:V-type ATP synthase beta chain [Candidatus Sulfobium mesophilum]
MRLSEHTFRSISSVAGPLLFVQGVFDSRIGEVVRVVSPEGAQMDGEVLEIDGDNVLIEVFGETRGLDIGKTSVTFTDSVRKVPLSEDIIGRIFGGSFNPVDEMPMFIPEKWASITGAPINPSARARPEEFIETGFSVIDGLNTLVKGQKLPVFSCAGLPSKEFVAQVLKNSRLTAKGESFMVVFAALGLTFHEYSYYMKVLEDMKTGFVAFINSADEPVMERLLAPRFALTVAEYLAFERGMDVLVIITDMTNYCDALREISTAREELPGRRGYPGYMYSDLASLYERAGRVRGSKGSVTMLPVLTMPEDDITHPIADLTGYITEGQIVLSRELHRMGIFPPVDVLPSLSRLMQKGIGKGRTREDHRKISNNLYKYYARGRDVRRLEAIVGREGMTEQDRRMLDFAESFEKEFVNQGAGRRTIAETLDTGIDIMRRFSLEIS